MTNEVYDAITVEELHRDLDIDQLLDLFEYAIKQWCDNVNFDDEFSWTPKMVAEELLGRIDNQETEDE